jgi:CRP-like cAMP-binding protein
MANQVLPTDRYRNALLRRLPADVVARLDLQRLQLRFDETLYEPNKPIDYAYFPESGVLSIAAVMANGSSIETGTVGREGMLGSALLLYVDSTPYRCHVQVAGDGYRMSAHRLRSVASESEPLREAILRYEALLRIQTMQGIACNGLHAIEQRCCRWLLMTHDRVDSDDLHLTHQFLAVMLGVRRASVSEVLKPLQALAIVRSHRGTLTILDRPALEKRACECYWIITERERLQLSPDERIGLIWAE